MTATATAIKPQPTEQLDAQDPAFEEIRWCLGSVFLALFAAALFDQAAIPEVSAALEATGRIRNDPLGRATRSAASHQIMAWGTEEDRHAEAATLKRLHRDVRGSSPDGRRYSALNPDLWRFIMASTLMMYHGAVAALLARQLSPEEDEALYLYMLHEMEPLQLPARNRLPDTWRVLKNWYEQMLERAATTATVRDAIRGTARPQRPDFLPAAASPVWSLVSPLAGHVLLTLGLGVMHPLARRRMPVRWGRLQELEFTILAGAVGIAYRNLSRRLVLTPLAYNRWQYERIVGKYRSVALDSFAPANKGALRSVAVSEASNG